jgi:DNA-binding CsgD family transcriptional regulator
MHSRQAMLEIAGTAAQLIDYQSEIKRAHEMGVAGGTCREPWSIERNRDTLPIVTKSLPGWWIEGLVRVTGRAGKLMAEHEPDPRWRCDWDLIALYFQNVALVFGEYLNDGTARELERRLPEPSDVPAMMRFEMMAAGIHPDATIRMINAASSVKDYALREAYEVTDRELEWLQELSRGDRAIDVGLRFGFSERDFYRAQQKLWKKLGVNGRTPALVRATELGWLAEDD